jgi:hypothetical protein
MKRSWPACKQSKFILMWIHHMLWCGGRGEDYDEFEGIRTSTCLSFESKLTMIYIYIFMISQWGIWVWWFPNVSQWGLGILYIEWCTMMMIFVQVISQWGFWVYFSVQSKTVSWALVSRIGLRGVFDGTVDGLVVWRLTVKVGRCTLGTCVWVAVHLVHNHTTTQQSRPTISHN